MPAYITYSPSGGALIIYFFSLDLVSFQLIPNNGFRENFKDTFNYVINKAVKELWCESSSFSKKRDKATTVSGSYFNE